MENLGLLGLFIGTFLAATILPFSSDALYIAVLAAVGDVFVISLGFFRVRPIWTIILLLFGKGIRFWIWTASLSALSLACAWP